MVRAGRSSSAANQPARAAARISSPRFAGAAANRGPREKFPFHRCPVCGHRADLGGRIILPIAVAVLAVLILVLVYAAAR